MVPQTFRSPVQNLADFLRSLAVPRLYYGTTSSPDSEAYEWAALRAQQRGTKRLDFHDHGLRGPEGAITVLRAVEQSPAVTALTLSVRVPAPARCKFHADARTHVSVDRITHSGTTAYASCSLA